MLKKVGNFQRRLHLTAFFDDNLLLFVNFVNSALKNCMLNELVHCCFVFGVDRNAIVVLLKIGTVRMSSSLFILCWLISQYIYYHFISKYFSEIMKKKNINTQLRNKSDFMNLEIKSFKKIYIFVLLAVIWLYFICLLVININIFLKRHRSWKSKNKWKMISSNKNSQQNGCFLNVSNKRKKNRAQQVTPHPLSMIKKNQIQKNKLKTT